MRYACPCCGCLTLEEPAAGTDDICPVCFWQDDGVQLRDPEFRGGANRPSLVDARRTFLEIGAVEERLLPFVRPPRPEERPDGG